MGFLTAEGIVAGYGAADEILKGVDLRLERHEVVSIIGPNGAGKSTFLKVIAGLLAPNKGRVTLEDQEIQGRPAREISALGLAYVPQEHNVFPTMSVLTPSSSATSWLSIPVAHRRTIFDRITIALPLVRRRRIGGTNPVFSGPDRDLAAVSCRALDAGSCHRRSRRS